MKLSNLKWWHWTVVTILIAAAIRLLTGGPLPFIGRLGVPAPKPAASAAAGRPAREANTGPQMRTVVTASGFSIDAATPERNRLTIDASVPNPGMGPDLVDQSGTLVIQIAKALQKGVSED